MSSDRDATPLSGITPTSQAFVKTLDLRPQICVDLDGTLIKTDLLVEAFLALLKKNVTMKPSRNTYPKGETHEAKPLDLPLFVDLDGTLLQSDSLHESLCLLCKARPSLLLSMPAWLARGKAYFKACVAVHVSPDVAAWPFNDALLAWLRDQKAKGRRIVLATAANQAIAERVAAHLGLFDEVIASDDVNNRSGIRKFAAIQSAVGSDAFSYVGNHRKDLAVWRGARGAVLVGVPASVEAEVRRTTTVEAAFPRVRPGLGTYLRAIRVHQWLKNLLVFLPLLPVLGHLDGSLLVHAIATFFAFSFCGSAGYVFNDLTDLESDRRHPRKRARPFASGQLSITTGVSLLGVFLTLGLALAAVLSGQFLVVLLVYFVVTTLYSLHLKRIVIVDVIVLAGLYTLRVIGGAIATGLPVTFWILAFCVFLFLSLALVKRCAELRVMTDHVRKAAPGRGYQTDDLGVLQSLGVSSGLMSVVVLAVYITAPTTAQHFRQPDLIGLLCGVLLYWIGRVWIKAHRGEMHDDPVLFAARDRVTHYLVVVGAFILAAAIWL